MKSSDNPSKPSHIHIIGICGVATGALAVAFKQKGWKVTGSDKGFYPPVSTELEEAGVVFYPGWHPEKMEADLPDIVMIGGSGKSSVNPEMLLAKEKNIPIYSYPEIIEKYFLRKNSIVCAGTWGKTTTSTVLSFILEKAGMAPTYMFGGVSLSQREAAKLTDSDWSVLEGDEYTGSQTDNIAKFFHYHPTHLLLTSVSWDHADVYPTEELYFDAFRKLIAQMPSGSLIVACADHEGVNKILPSANDKKIVSYGQNEGSLYRYSDVQHDKNGLSFNIKKGSEVYPVHSSMLGRFNVENLTACFAMACEVGIEPSVIINALKEFKGIKRRMEKRFTGDVTLIDFHAPTPEKATYALQSIKEVFDGNIFAVYEPNTGGRQKESLGMYDNAFKDATEIIIPRLSKLKKDDDSKSEPIEGPELAAYILQTHKNVWHIEDDEELVAHIVRSAKKDDVIVFLGSHGFRGMIESTIAKLK